MPDRQKITYADMPADYRCAPKAATLAATLLWLGQRLKFGFGLGIGRPEPASRVALAGARGVGFHEVMSNIWGCGLIEGGRPDPRVSWPARLSWFIG